MVNDGGEETQAATKVIVKKPITELKFVESDETLIVGEGKRLAVIGTEGNTDTGDLSFSVNGKGVKVSKSGYVVATAPNSRATVTVKSGTIKDTISVKVSSFGGKYLTINKNSIVVTAPKPGGSSRTVKLQLATPKKIDQPWVSWSIMGSPKGISVNENTGEITVDSSALPGCYVVVVAPKEMFTSDSYKEAHCELIVK